MQVGISLALAEGAVINFVTGAMVEINPAFRDPSFSPACAKGLCEVPEYERGTTGPHHDWNRTPMQHP